MNIHLLLTICFMLWSGKGVDAQFSAEGTNAEIFVTPNSEPLKRLYSLNGNSLMWFCESCGPKRRALIQIMERAEEFGLPKVYKTAELKGNISFASDAEKANADQKLSNLAIAFVRDLYCGRDIDHLTSYDGISRKYTSQDTARIFRGLAEAKDSAGIVSFIHSLEPQTAEYNNLKLALQQDTLSELNKRKLRVSLDYYRWIRHFGLDSFIVINIPAARLKYYQGGDVALDMLAVVGKTNNKTPRFAAYCREVTLYPYWNMPRSILINEYLEKLRRNPGTLDDQGMEIIDKKGQVVSAYTIDWSKVSKSNFPYRLREKPGCSNALGVLKFSLDSPFDVYMHDTNFKGAFSSKKRFLSHGCIRIERPVDLANAVLENKVDEEYLSACFKDEKPQVVAVRNPIPVFVVYKCAETDSSGAVRYYDDVYGLMK